MKRSFCRNGQVCGFLVLERMSSDGQTQSQLNKECEEMIKGSRIHLNPRMAELRRIVLFQLQKYSSWFPEKCTTTEESF